MTGELRFSYDLHMSHESPSEIIDRLGGTVAVARLCEVEPPSVSEWRHRGIPRARLMYLKLAKPEVFRDHDHAPHKEAA